MKMKTVIASFAMTLGLVGCSLPKLDTAETPYKQSYTRKAEVAYGKVEPHQSYNSFDGLYNPAMTHFLMGGAEGFSHIRESEWPAPHFDSGDNEEDFSGGSEGVPPCNEWLYVNVGGEDICFCCKDPFPPLQLC
jgi:hypothetical protein